MENVLLERSKEKELLDLGPDYYTEQEYVSCQKFLFQINKMLGIYRSTLKILKKLKSPNCIMDIGCGGGLFILNLARHLPKSILIGNDISKPATKLAIKNRTDLGITKEHVLFKHLKEPNVFLEESSVDVILATLVCHHMSDAEIIIFLQQGIKKANDRVIINDLHRNSIAYLLYFLFSPIFCKNRLIQHDGLLSIKRGFKRSEWQALLKQAGIINFEIKWCFPFRWRVTLWKK